jgi:extracellular elastinolytic metalloproteinase
VRSLQLPRRLRLPAATLASLLLGVSAATAAQGSKASEDASAAPGLHRVVDIDPLTGTPRVLAQLDGFLTSPADGDAREIVLDYVRARPALFNLDADDLAGLRLVRDETDPFGVRHLVWAQAAGGIPAFANDLRASVTSDGRILNVMGSPLPDLTLPNGAASVGAGEAVSAVLREADHPAARPPRRLGAPRGTARVTRFAGGHAAALVLVDTGRGVRRAWHVTAEADSDEIYTSLVDADSGEVLESENKVADVSGLAWDYYPGAASGGTQSSRAFTSLGWLSANAETLNGANALVFSDWNDNDTLDPSGGGSVGGNENTDPTIAWSFDDFTHPVGLCAPTYTSTCSWDSTDNGPFPQPPGWYSNRRQNAIQVFYFVNRFHDHLEEDADIAWTTHNFEGVDKVVAHAGDGADTGTSGQFLGVHMPDPSHVNNANMFTPPEGQSPQMQMYLFVSSTGNINTDPIPDVNGGDDASVVYHEYAHGLSNRLVTYANGWGALDSFQSGAMGEGWSDWYAMDFLVGEGFAPDTGAVGDVKLDRYVANNRPVLRTEGLDCPVVSATGACPGGDATGSDGGYTFGDMGHVWAGGAEVHADGEIWAQTLWDLRGAVGVGDGRFLVTEAMRLSPPNPSFLDMRNAILQANEVGVLNGRSDHEPTIWQVFAERGMGYFAGTEDADDTEPIESFVLPPDPNEGVGSLVGKVRDADTGKPLAGAQVRFAGLGLGDTTDALGAYAIPNVPVGTYPQVVASKAGFDRDVDTNVDVAADSEATADFELRRDWAAFDGGARIAAFAGPNFGPIGCGPSQAIDQSLDTGWSTALPDLSPTGPRSITVMLPSYVDVSSFALDPGAICGDPDAASARGYKLETSTTGKSGTWTVVGTGSFTLGQAHQLNAVAITPRKAVRFVRVTITSNHGDPNWMDLAELVVHGVARPACLGKPATKVGTDAANVINGGPGADVIVGLGGNDTLDGKGGRDVLCAGPGNDRLTGGLAVDQFDGGDGNDLIYSRDGVKETTVKGGSGTDKARRDNADKTTSVERRFYEPVSRRSPMPPGRAEASFRNGF